MGWGTKVCLGDLDHMTKMAAPPVVGKNLQISSSSELVGQWQLKVVCSIWDAGPS